MAEEQEQAGVNAEAGDNPGAGSWWSKSDHGADDGAIASRLPTPRRAVYRGEKTSRAGPMETWRGATDGPTTEGRGEREERERYEGTVGNIKESGRRNPRLRRSGSKGAGGKGQGRECSQVGQYWRHKRLISLPLTGRWWHTTSQEDVGCLNVKVHYKRRGPGHEWWFMASLQNGDCNRWLKKMS